MESVLREQGGLALAAPQIGIPYRLVIMNVPERSPNPRYDFDQDPNHKAFPMNYMINPSFTPMTEEKKEGWESCLSLPGYRGKVARYESIKCTWQNIVGQVEYMRLDGFNARVFQHEYDHLDGITYIQRIDDLRTFTYIGDNGEK